LDCHGITIKLAGCKAYHPSDPNVLRSLTREVASAWMFHAPCQKLQLRNVP
jgi:hypothetical protein